MPKKVRKFIFPATTLIAFFSFPVFFGIGIITGYLATKIFHEKFINTKKIKLVFINFGKWQIHLHHWLMGVLIIIFVALGGWLPVLPKIIIGSVCGMTLHDLHFDDKWYQVVLKKY